MNYIYYSESSCSDYLAHHGVKGQRWGIRRFQNPDGTLTAEGKRRYGKVESVGESLSKGTKTVGKGIAKGVKAIGRGVGYVGKGIGRGVGMQVAKRAPFMLSDEAIEKYRERLELDNKYRKLIEDRKAIKRQNKGESFAKKLAQDSARTMLNKAVNKLADEMIKTDQERMKEAFELQNQSRLNSLRSTIMADESKNQADRSRLSVIEIEKDKHKGEVDALTTKLGTLSVHDPEYLSVKNRLRTAENAYTNSVGEFKALNAQIKNREQSIKDRRDIIGSHSSGKK